MDDYIPLFNLPEGVDNIESVFRTQRPGQPEGVGSTYAHFSDATTVRNRSSAGHKDPSEGLQAKSGRTIFMDPKDINRLGAFQNPDSHTSFMPIMENGKPTGQVALKYEEDYGPKKAGTVIHQAPYEMKPRVGLAPVEIWNSKSPIGSAGEGVHFGNTISEVHPKPARLIKNLPIGGNGGYRPGVDSLQHSLNPLKLAKGGMIDKPLMGGHKTI
jgi:hypothetical protein